MFKLVKQQLKRTGTGLKKPAILLVLLAVSKALFAQVPPPPPPPPPPPIPIDNYWAIILLLLIATAYGAWKIYQSRKRASMV